MAAQSGRCHPIALADGELQLYGDLLPPAKSGALLDRLMAELDWCQETIRLFGRQIPTPRLTAWYGDAAYRYSGIDHPPRAWPPVLEDLRDLAEQTTHARYNTVLANLYRDGRDGMSWHSDDEPELGPNPTIASLSFGATRRFRFRRKNDRSGTFAVDLPDASLLLMAGPIQHHWQHALTKSKKHLPPRVNLTFRLVKTIP